MPMIEPGRTNIIPRTLLILCIALFVLRAGAVFYGTYFHKGPDKLITWRQPKPLDRSRRDLLSKPTLYFFFEDDNPLQRVTAEVFESMLFHNREVAQLVNDEFVPIKVPVTSNNAEPAKSLSTALGVFSYPSIYVTLSNGKKVHRTSWQSDRMFQAFLKDALISSLSKAGKEAMEHADWTLASEAYEKTSNVKVHSPFFNKFDAINWAVALEHLNQTAKAKEVLEKESKTRRLPEFIAGKDGWPQPCIDYMLGKISAEKLNTKDPVDKHDYKAPMIHWVIGEKLLLEGNKEDAIKELRLSSAASKSSFVPAAKYARAQLRQLGEKVEEEKEEEDYSY